MQEEEERSLRQEKKTQWSLLLRTRTRNNSCLSAAKSSPETPADETKASEKLVQIFYPKSISVQTRGEKVLGRQLHPLLCYSYFFYATPTPFSLLLNGSHSEFLIRIGFWSWKTRWKCSKTWEKEDSCRSMFINSQAGRRPSLSLKLLSGRESAALHLSPLDTHYKIDFCHNSKRSDQRNDHVWPQELHGRLVRKTRQRSMALLRLLHDLNNKSLG